MSTKMGAAKPKDILQKFSFLKTYSPLIIPLFIVGLGVIVFVLTYTTSNKLKQQVSSKSVAAGRNIEQMINNIPSKDQWKEEQKYQQAMEKDAERISLLPKETSQRELLSYSIFPKPQDASRAIFQEFGKNYRQSIKDLIASVNARDCPTQAEINRDISNRGSRSGSTGNSEIIDAYCIARAKSISLYANPSDISGYTFWDNYEFPGTDKALADCWYWQIGYWIIEDVFKTVEAMNYGSNSVLTSPVKRIVTVDFELSRGYFSGISTFKNKASKSTSIPKYVKSPSEEFTPSVTGRLTNDKQDIVHFEVSVILRIEAIPRFMKELCSAKEHVFKGFSGTDEKKIFKHNQITILEMSMEPVDPEASQHQRYRYGDDAVVRLDLTCEYLFIKEGYEPIKPEVVKNEKKKQTTGPSSS